MARSRQPKLVVRIVAGLLVALLLAGLLVSAFAGAGSNNDSPAADATSTTDTRGVSGLPTVVLSELPPEALDTITLIANGGPYPFEQDGGTFQNREGLLPDQPLGYYAEYTVETPGSDDRGARRIIVGGELEIAYWTDDHYESFREIVAG